MNAVRVNIYHIDEKKVVNAIFEKSGETPNVGGVTEEMFRYECGLLRM